MWGDLGWGPEVHELREEQGVFSVLNVLLEDSGNLPEPDGGGSSHANVSCESLRRDQGPWGQGWEGRPLPEAWWADGEAGGGEKEIKGAFEKAVRRS